MEFLRHLLLVVHLLAFATVFGALIGQLGSAERKVTELTAWGARIVFLAGLLLVGVLEADDADVDHAKVGTKLIVALVVVALVEANRKAARLTNTVYWAIVGLTALNVGIAVFWR